MGLVAARGVIARAVVERGGGGGRALGLVAARGRLLGQRVERGPQRRSFFTWRTTMSALDRGIALPNAGAGAGTGRGFTARPTMRRMPREAGNNQQRNNNTQKLKSCPEGVRGPEKCAIKRRTSCGAGGLKTIFTILQCTSASPARMLCRTLSFRIFHGLSAIAPAHFGTRPCSVWSPRPVEALQGRVNNRLRRGDVRPSD